MSIKILYQKFEQWLENLRINKAVKMFESIATKYPGLDSQNAGVLTAYYQIENIRKWQWVYLILTIIGMIFSGIAGGYVVHELTKDTSPQIFVNFDLVELKQLEIILTNGKDNIAADVKIKSIPQLNPSVYYYQIDTLEKGKKESRLFDIDPYYLMMEAIKNNRDITFEQENIEIDDLCSDVEVTFKGYQESDIIYIDKIACFSVRCRYHSNIEAMMERLGWSLESLFTSAVHNKNINCDVISAGYD